jgi:lipopolysaccharide biosynthesis glycosyltransferase
LKVVYVLVAQGGDVYEKMTVVSILSLKYFHKKAEVSVFVDNSTFLQLRKSNSIIFDIANKVESLDVPPGNSTFKSRWIKTQLAIFVRSPFLYLDSDTLVLGKLDNLFCKEAGIYLAPNHSMENIENQIFDGDRSIIDQLNWTYNPDIYYNGGIIFFNDQKNSEFLCKAWHNSWLISVNETQQFRDQPSLNKILFENNIPVKKLENRYNAQIAGNFCTYKNALILHFYTLDFKFDLKYNQIVKTNYSDNKMLSRAVGKLVENKKITINNTIVAGFLLNKFCRRGALSKSEYQILNSNSTVDNIKFICKTTNKKLRELSPINYLKKITKSI